MHKTRLQLTLFIDDGESESIEKIRKEFNPKQYELIKSHVTLCREDELEQIEKVILNLEKLNIGFITVDFGNVIRFSDGVGVLIPAVDDNQQFHQLRKAVLQGLIEQPRRHEPHITLMHPRNSTCTDSIFEQIEKMQLPQKIEFRKISLIEQELGIKWRVLKEFELKEIPHTINRKSKVKPGSTSSPDNI